MLEYGNNQKEGFFVTSYKHSSASLRRTLVQQKNKDPFFSKGVKSGS
jgi:hypothetical protein